MKKLLKIILFENCFGLKLVSFFLGHLGLYGKVDPCDLRPYEYIRMRRVAN